MSTILGISVSEGRASIALIRQIGGKMVAHTAWDYRSVAATDLTHITAVRLAGLITNYPEVQVVALVQPTAAERKAVATLHAALLSMCARLGLVVRPVTAANLRQALCPGLRATQQRQHEAAVAIAGGEVAACLVPAIGAAWYVRGQLISSGSVGGGKL